MRAVQKQEVVWCVFLTQVALMQRSGHVCQLSELFLVRRELSSARLGQLTSRVRSDSKGTITDIAYHRLHTLEKICRGALNFCTRWRLVSFHGHGLYVART